MILVSLIFFPIITYAKDAIEIATELLNGSGRVVAIAVRLLMGLAILAFFWGIVRYIWSQGSEGKVEGKKVMLYALVAVFVMFSLWGIIEVARITFGVEGEGDFTVPRVNSGGSGGGGNGSSPRWTDLMGA